MSNATSTSGPSPAKPSGKSLAASLFTLRRVFPVFWFGLLGLFLLVSIATIPSRGLASLPFIIVPILMAVFGGFMMKYLVWSLLDEVIDTGDTLYLRKGRVELVVPISDVVDVSQTMMMNPPRVELVLAKPSALGGRVAFSPKRASFINPFATSPDVDDLIRRVRKR